MKCLWIARDMPYPLDGGAKVYSAKLAEALAAAGARVRFLGLGSADAVPRDAAVEYVPVGSYRRGPVTAMLSRLPLAAAIDATDAYGTLLDEQLRAEWDAIVLDGYGSGWALPRCLPYVREQRVRRTALVHVSHNHEAVVWGSTARTARGSLARRAVQWQNSIKVRALERTLVRSVDVLSAICEEDLAALRSSLPPEQMLTLTPGFAGPVMRERFIGEWTPRRVILVGSFRRVMNQDNLARFVECADPVFRRHGIQLDIVGDVPQALLAELEPRCQATIFHGCVDELAPLLRQARIAVAPELIDGGFKLKFLDYFFARVPIATLSTAVAGLPVALCQSLMAELTLPALVQRVVEHIDRVDELNRMQDRAFHAACTLFRWEDRGVRLKHAIANVQRQWQHVGHDVAVPTKACAARTI